MGWYRLFFLSMFVISISACAEWQVLPVQLYVDTNFSNLEQEAIADAVAEWNRQAGYRYEHGDTVLEIVGLVTDDFTEADYEDDFHIIYRLSEPSAEEQYLQEVNGGACSTLGNATLSDALLIMYNFDQFMIELEVEQRERATQLGYDDQNLQASLDRFRFNFVRNLALHELGHLLGLLHHNDRVGVMNDDGLSFLSSPEYLSDADLDAFCLIYDCHCSCL